MIRLGLQHICLFICAKTMSKMVFLYNILQKKDIILLITKN